MKAFIFLVFLVTAAVSQEVSEPSTPEPPIPTTADLPSTGPTDPPSTGPTDPPSTGPTDPPSTGPTDPPNTDPIDPPVVCDISLDDDENVILLPDPKSCENFYACNHGLPILMVCPDGLHFNPILSICDWPENANCAINGQPGPLP